MPRFELHVHHHHHGDPNVSKYAADIAAAKERFDAQAKELAAVTAERDSLKAQLASEQPEVLSAEEAADLKALGTPPVPAATEPAK